MNSVLYLYIENDRQADITRCLEKFVTDHLLIT